MPKILQVVGYATLGGAEKNTGLLTKAFARRGHTCHLISPPGDILPHYQALREFGVVHHTLDFRNRPWESLARIRALVREQRFDLIHSHLFLADIMVYFATLGLSGPRRISTIHSSILAQAQLTGQSRLRQRLLSSLAFRSFNRIFTVSESLRGESLDYFRLPPEKVVTTLNSLDFTGMTVDADKRTELAARYGLAAPGFKIGCVGHFFPYKSQVTLIRAVGLHLRDLKDIRIFLIGDGDEREHLQAEAEKHGLADRVCFTGLQEDMNEWYSLLDMFVHTSFAEALSRSILEAMFFGLPIVASDIPSSREIIASGETGLFFPSGDDLKLAESIRSIHGDRSKAAAMGARAKRFVLENCSMEATIDTLLAHSLPQRN
ncbi:MAG: glgA3 [Fibrobacteres bacterium]|nr:glgA3 [Fibrobacterota bacterium]